MVTPVSGRTDFLQSAMSSITIRENISYDGEAVEEAADRLRELELNELQQSPQQNERVTPDGIGENIDYYA
ncbi:hypothetical protein [Halarsenatibacter silvermanii]|uniref:Uncharacterized protein n=1 Tax=Halarsenatibacter silvermanii TaxID=321763 RepID=A0A1G9M1T3_9FIRM|nr:hypothetical protein [Halarsenatibacter silvermanii]SDL68168.1 hypothetical protein SAMN04488692_10779 [Halarsenatibacter silvermanii]